ncbi:hypothetical protein HMPREF1553_00843 [Porphyromonas gingivalis F0568]|nr:hypothetical protein HMPREF1553_00843 [Porphyromonas gingivalis F0568]
MFLFSFFAMLFSCLTSFSSISRSSDFGFYCLIISNLNYIYMLY